MITFILVLIVVGFVLFLFNKFVTVIDPTIKSIINAIVIFAIVMVVILLVLDAAGWYHFPINKLKE